MEIRAASTRNRKRFPTAAIIDTAALDVMPAAAYAKRVLAAEGVIRFRVPGMSVPGLLDYAKEIAELWDPVHPVIDIRYDPESSAVAFSRKHLPPHCECAYDEEPPRYLLLYCADAGEDGGDLYLVSMAEVLAKIGAEFRAVLRRQHFIVTSPRTHASVSRPLLTPVAEVGEALVFTAIPPPPGAAPRYVLPSGASRVSQLLLARLATVTSDPSIRLHHQWNAGDLVVIDNARFLHGRQGFVGVNRRIIHIRLGRFRA